MERHPLLFTRNLIVFW